MARIAFLPYPAYGHMTPALPVVAELVRRGNEVSCFSSDEFWDRVVATGARACGYGVPLESTGRCDAPGADEGARAPLRLLEETMATVPAVWRAFPDSAPDLLVYDTTLWAPGRLLGRKWGVPTVQLSATVASNEHFSLTKESQRFGEAIDPAHPALAEFVTRLRWHLDEHGISASLEDFFTGHDEFTLVFVTRRFQPAGSTFDERYTFVGSPARPAVPGSGGWSPPAGDTPVVLVTLGTTVNRQPEFFRTCAEAFAGLPWHVVLTLGKRIAPAQLGPLPANVEAHQWIPHADVLPHCSVFLCQGGMGSLMESLYHGVPVVVVPHHPEQRINAERVAELRLGLVIDRDRVRAPVIRDAVVALAADTDIRRRVEEMRREVRAAGGAAAAADAIERRIARILEGSRS